MTAKIGLLPRSAWLPEGFVQEASGSFIPISGFLVKVASRCNLNCSYCYVYQSPDKSWAHRPKFMSDEVARLTAERVDRHVRVHKLKEVYITFHGGEPLLAGPKRLARYIEIFQDTISCTQKFGIQTNGTLLTPELLNVLAAAKVSIGISLDGDSQANDRNRVFRNGRGSYNSVFKGINLLRSRPEWWQLLSGALSVVDLQNDPCRVYEEIQALELPSVDFLLPDGHHDAPPKRCDPSSGVEYADWLLTIFDRWYDEPPDKQVPIRLFIDIMAIVLGGRSTTESIGNPPVDFIVIEADGDIEALDVLKVVGRSATHLGLSVRQHDFDDALQLPAIFSRNVGTQALCAECRQCTYEGICGGGYLPHRYGLGNGFLNPSVYCADLKALIPRVRARVLETFHRLSPEERCGVTPPPFT